MYEWQIGARFKDEKLGELTIVSRWSRLRKGVRGETPFYTLRDQAGKPHSRGQKALLKQIREGTLKKT